MGRKGTSGVKIRIQASGFDEVIRALGSAAANRLEAAVEIDVAAGVRKMTLAAFKNAPVETGALRSSILKSITREGSMEYIFGSYMPYAQRQEYEHRTKNRYLHRAVWSEQGGIERDIKKSIRRSLR